MINFNTNQTRFLYVAKAINANVGKDRNAADNAAAVAGDIAFAQTETGEAYFKYKNADGLITRSDSFDPKKIVSLKKTVAAKLATNLQAHKITQNSTDVTLSTLSGKSVDLVVTVHEAYDYSSTTSFVASFMGNATNTADASAFYNALAKAIVAAMPKGDGYPAFKVYVCTSTAATEVTKTSASVSSVTSVVLAQAPQKFVVGKLSGEPCPITVAFRGDIPEWGVDTPTTVAALNAVLTTDIPVATISGTNVLANLEYFAAGERGDYARGFNYPNDYPFTPLVDLSATYDMITVEYYWAGEAENVQKSPRIIQIACLTTASITDTLYDAIDAARAGLASS